MQGVVSAGDCYSKVFFLVVFHAEVPVPFTLTILHIPPEISALFINVFSMSSAYYLYVSY